MTPIKTAFFGAAALLLGACANTPVPEGGSQASDTLTGCLSKGNFDNITSLSNLSQDVNSRLDAFLNCYVGPKVSEGEEVSDSVKLLRGHMIATVVSRYAAFNITGEVGDSFNLNFSAFDQMSDVSEDVVGSLTRIERNIRTASGLFKEQSPEQAPYYFLPTVNSAFQTVERIERVLDLVAATKKGAEPTARRGRLFLSKLAATVSTPTPDAIKDLFRDVKAGISKLAVLDLFSGAYITDTRAYLTCVNAREKTGAKPAGGICAASLKEDWQRWDGLLNEACDRLAKVGRVANTCTPFTYK